jgi:chromosome segregation ATPase
MKQILKRLELIKTSITIEDEEIIELQIIKLSNMDIDNNVKSILQQLQDKDYKTAIIDIENYIKRYTGVVVYEDKELQALKLELKALEKKLQELSETKTEYQKNIEEFNILYNINLGALIQKILNLKQEILRKETLEKQERFEKLKKEYKESKEEVKKTKKKKKDIEKELEDLDEFDEEYEELYEEYEELKEEIEDKEEELKQKRKKTKQAKEDLEDDETYQEYEETKKDYQDFKEEYEEILKEDKNRHKLNKDDEKELKRIFRKCAKLCHPDIVLDEFKDKAHDIMQELNDAYSKKDLNRIKEIFENLQNGTIFEVVSEAIENKEILRSKVVEFRKTINKILDDINNIKSDEMFDIISNPDNWDSYFEDTKKYLQKEYEALQDRFNKYNSTNHQDDEYDFWESEF